MLRSNECSYFVIRFKSTRRNKSDLCSVLLYSVLIIQYNVFTTSITNNGLQKHVYLCRDK